MKREKNKKTRGELAAEFELRAKNVLKNITKEDLIRQKNFTVAVFYGFL